VCSGFPKRSCSIKDLKRDDDSIQAHRALDFGKRAAALLFPLSIQRGRLHRKKIDISTVLAGPKPGIEEVTTTAFGSPASCAVIF